jgi:hypothetical protein
VGFDQSEGADQRLVYVRLDFHLASVVTRSPTAVVDREDHSIIIQPARFNVWNTV